MKKLQVGIDISTNAKSSLQQAGGGEMLSVGLPDSPSVLSSTQRGAKLDLNHKASPSSLSSPTPQQPAAAESGQ